MFRSSLNLQITCSYRHIIPQAHPLCMHPLPTGEHPVLTDDRWPTVLACLTQHAPARTDVGTVHTCCYHASYLPAFIITLHTSHPQLERARDQVSVLVQGQSGKPAMSSHRQHSTPAAWRWSDLCCMLVMHLCGSLTLPAFSFCLVDSGVGDAAGNGLSNGMQTVLQPAR